MCDNHRFDNPFDDLQDVGKPQGKLPGSDPANDLPSKVHAEHWQNYANVYDIAIPVHNTNPSVAAAVAQNWRSLYQYLSGAVGDHKAFVQTFGQSDLWQGQTADAVNKAMKDYSDALQQLTDRVSGMADVTQYAADTVHAVQAAIPSETEINQKIDDAGATEESERAAARQDLLVFAQRQMTDVYNPGITGSAAAAPTFSGPQSAAPDTSGPGPSGPGSVGAGPSGMGPGAPSSMPSGASPDVSALMKPASGVKTSTAGSQAGPAGVPSGVSSGLSQLSGLGQSAAQQAKSAAQQLASLAKNPLSAAQGLHALGAAKKALSGAGIASSGKGGGGGSGKGGGGAGGLGKSGASGLKALSDAEKAALSRGAKSLSEAERAAVSSRGVSASSGGAPMGGGAGGARGAGGEDKEHKANKFLRTTVNGEVLVGAPPVVTAAVIKEA